MAAALIAACGGQQGLVDQNDGPGVATVPADIPDAKPHWEPRSLYGNPESYRVNGKRYKTLDSAEGFMERGVASWYGTKFHGQRTSSGEPYDMYAMTAAHKTLPLPTYVRVTNLENGSTAVLRVNDRGPFHDNRIIDLSYTAATKLGIAQNGTGLVEVRAITPDSARHAGAAVAPPTPAPELFIQVGAFSSRGNAETLKSTLEGHEIADVAIYDGSSNGSVIYRVRVGPLEDVESADSVYDRLGSLGLGGYRLVID